ncbi:MAG: AMP-binding protein, partial [Acidobacteria bacterium]|nr:AMP-binding protein [Acidobacteriota bacterium]
LGRPDGPARVALTARAETQTVVRLLALIELGVPFAPLHPRLTAPERAAHCAALAPLLDLDDLPPVDPFAPARRAALASARLPVLEDDERPLAFVFTSGTSGAPRAAILSRRAFAAAAAASAARLGWREEDRWLLSLPLARIGGLSIVTRCLTGRRAIVIPADAAPQALAAAADEGRATLTSLVPTQLARWLAAERAGEALAGLRAILLGGAEIPAPLLHSARERRLPVLPTWGMTETCAQAATVPPGLPPDPAHGCGPPLPGVSLQIVDGRVAVRGPTLFSGYLPAEPEASPGAAGWFVTRDLGRIDERGSLHLEGRVDELILVAGENVAPREVEAALACAPGVRAALAFAVPDPDRGEVVGAAVVRGSEPPLDDDALAAWLAARLAPFKLPRRLAWVDALPEGPEGKPDRRGAAVRLDAFLRPFPASWPPPMGNRDEPQ